MTEATQTQPTEIRIGEKWYAVDSITETGLNYIRDIQTVEGEINRIKLQESIANLAKTSLTNSLLAEAVNFKEVPEPE